MEINMVWLIVVALLTVLTIYKLKSSHAFVYKFKYFTSFSTVMLAGVLYFPLCLVRPKDVANIGEAAKFWNLVFPLWGIKHEVRNAEYLISDKPMIVMSNHQSGMDLMAMMKVWPSRCTALAKNTLKYFGPFGISGWLAGLVFVDRLNREKARATMSETSKLLIEKNLKLWVFAEGTRNLDNGLLPFKKGGFHLAVEAQVPIVPVVMSSYRHFLDCKNQYFNKGNVIITILPPISTVGLTPEDVNDLVENTRNQMVEVFKSSTQEIEERARKNGETEVLNLIQKKTH